MPKTRNVRLRTPDSELEFAIQPNTTGKLLFEQVSKTVGLREVWFFGIAFTDSKGEKEWIKLGKKVIGGHDLRKQDPIDLELKIKFFPESAEEDLVQEVTKRYFFLELKQAILNDEIYCSAPTCALLASYACQVKYGDYNDSIQYKNDKLLPARVIEQHNMSQNEWAEKIASFWKQYQDMIREDAMLEYIKIVQDLEMYGVGYFEIKNKKGTDLLLGVDALGLNIYEKENKLTPRIGFPWSEIRNISFNEKKFIIKPIDKKAPDFIFFTTRLRTNKRILSLCMGNHEMYMRRRKGDTIEIQQMKAQVKEERDEKLAEKERQRSLRHEREAMEEENRKLRQEMEEVRLREHELAENLKLKEQEKEESERKAWELETANQQRDEEIRQLLERRAQIEEEMEKQKVEYAIKSAEDNERINEQLINLQVEKDQLEQKYALANMEKSRQQEQYELREREHELQLRHAGMQRIGSVDEDVRTASVDMTYSANLVNDKSEESRETYHGQDRMTQQLLALSQELAKDKNTAAMTQNDIIHQENIVQKREKYKTLKQVRSGNTKQRVDQFEMLS